MKALAAVAGICLLFTNPLNAQDAQQNAKKGKDAWMTYSCYACHGYSGNGGNGPKLAQGGRFNNATALTNYVRNPPRPNLMPSYSNKVLQDAELADMFAFLKSIPASPAAKDVALLAELTKP